MRRSATPRWDVDPAWAARLAAAGIGDARTLLDASRTVRTLRDRSNHLLHVGGTRLYVKRHQRESSSPEARGLRSLGRCGVPSAVLVASGFAPEVGSVAAVEGVEPAAPIADLVASGRLEPTAATGRAILDRLAVEVAAMHEAGIVHGSLYLDHVVTDPLASEVRIALIDAERVGDRGRRPFGRRVIKDLAALDSSATRLGVARTARLRFLRVYLAHRSALGGRHARPLVRRIARKARRILRHVPRTPVGEAARPREWA